MGTLFFPPPPTFLHSSVTVAKAGVTELSAVRSNGMVATTGIRNWRRNVTLNSDAERAVSFRSKIPMLYK